MFFQETAKLEHEAFLLQQKTALASEIKATLDSWIRYETQARESEQAELVSTVINKVMADLQDAKVQKDILASAVAEIEGAQQIELGVYIVTATRLTSGSFDAQVSLRRRRSKTQRLYTLLSQTSWRQTRPVFIYCNN